MVNEIVTRVTNDLHSHLHTIAQPPSVMPDLAPSTITPTTEVQATANHVTTDNLLANPPTKSRNDENLRDEDHRFTKPQS